MTQAIGSMITLIKVTELPVKVWKSEYRKVYRTRTRILKIKRRASGDIETIHASNNPTIHSLYYRSKLCYGFRTEQFQDIGSLRHVRTELIPFEKGPKKRILEKEIYEH